MPDELSVQVCVVGGGPAGLTLGLELARLGVRVAVVEQSGHFNRSFRGESVSPDSVWLLDRLGMPAGCAARITRCAAWRSPTAAGS